MFKRKGWYFAPATDDGTGPVQQADAGKDAPGQNDPPVRAAISFETEEAFQKRVDEMLKDRLERERKKSEKAATEAREKAEAEAAAKNGEWQKLAETREAKIGELNQAIAEAETIKAKAEKFEKALTALLAKQREGLPPHITALLDRFDAAEQIEYLAANAETIKQQMPPQPPQPQKLGNGTPPRQPTPRQTDGVKPERSSPTVRF